MSTLSDLILAWAADSGYVQRADGWYDEDNNGPYHDIAEQYHAAMEAAAACAMTPIPGAVQIADERLRQITAEGWTPEHDDTHKSGELVHAARAYLSVYNFPTRIVASDGAASSAGWPWGFESWKPSDDPIKNLRRAGALIAAEIDRLERQAHG